MSRFPLTDIDNRIQQDVADNLRQAADAVERGDLSMWDEFRGAAASAAESIQRELQSLASEEPQIFLRTDRPEAITYDVDQPEPNPYLMQVYRDFEETVQRALKFEKDPARLREVAEELDGFIRVWFRKEREREEGRAEYERVEQEHLKV